METNTTPNINNGTRAEILQVIKRFPGIHFRALQRVLGIANGSLQYHLDVLENQGLVKKFKGYGYTRFYPKEYENINHKVMSVLTHPTVENLLTLMLRHEKITLKEISETLGISQSTVLWHLRRLEDAGIISKETDDESQRRKHLYSINNKKEIENLIRIRKLSLLDKLSNNWINLWDLKL